MKIFLFLNKDIHAINAAEMLCENLQKHEVKIFLSQAVGDVSALPQELLALKKFEQIGADEKLQQLAKKLGAQVEICAQVNEEKFLQKLRQAAPDLFLSVRFGQIFHEAAIKIPKRGVINFHSGILPNYRGIMATFWAILRGEKEIGTTLHYIDDSGIDTGNIIAVSRVKLNSNFSLFGNVVMIYEATIGVVSEAIEKINRGENLPRISQKNLPNAQYFSYPKTADIAKFLEIMPLF
jgi:methionyl-tRNA formyltransferase